MALRAGLSVIELRCDCVQCSADYHSYNCPQGRLLQAMTGGKIAPLCKCVKNEFAESSPGLPNKPACTWLWSPDSGRSWPAVQVICGQCVSVRRV